jgi:hypothetical protein
MSTGLKKIVRPIQNETYGLFDSKNEEKVEDPIPFKKIEMKKSKINFKKVPSLKQKLDDVKLSNSQNDFLEDVKHTLSLFDKEDLLYNEDLVLFLMQQIEEYILISKSGEFKFSLLVECVKEYYNNDIDLVKMVVRLCFPKLKQVRFVERQLRKGLRFFSKILHNQTSNS